MASALDAALRYLASRPRSEREVRRRLQRGGRFTQEQVDVAVARLRADGLLDDEAFAHYWVEQRHTFRPRGARLLNAELRQHGVASELATAATDAVDTAEEDAYRVGYKRALQLAGADQAIRRARVGQLLARRGFDWDTINTVLQRLEAELSRS